MSLIALFVLFSAPVSAIAQIQYSETFINGTGTTSGSPQFTSWQSFRASIPGSGVNNIVLSGSRDIVGRSCSDPVVAQQIATALANRTYISVACDGNTWRTSSCSVSPGHSGDVELSVGTGSSCSCTNTDYILRPGIFNQNWGGISGPTCNATTQTITLTLDITDTVAPVIAGTPANITVNTDAGLPTAVVSWTPPTATDNVGVTSLTSSHNPGDTFPIGTTTVTYTALDAAGNITTDTFTVTVNDNEAPVVSVPADITVATDGGSSTAVVTFTPTATDNDAIATLVSSPASGSAFVIGTTTVTVTATDNSGNITTDTFTVTVNDNEAPVVSVPADITVATDGGSATAVVSFTPTATDNDAIATLVSSPASGSAFVIGTTTVTVTATDNSGNITTDTFTVTVNDNEAPVFNSFPSNIVIEVDFPSTSAPASWIVPTASDNAPGVVVNQIAGGASNSSFNEGTTTITYEAVDAAGNRIEQSFTVTVNQIPPGSITLVVNSSADGLFAFNSPEGVLNFNVSTSGGTGTSGPIDIRPGTYPLAFVAPAGVGIVSVVCSAGGSILDPVTMDGNIVLTSGSNVVCTINALNSVAETVGQIGSFLEARSQLVLQSQPALDRRLDRLNGRSRSEVVNGFGFSMSSPNLPISAYLAEDTASFSWSLRNAKAQNGGVNASADIVSIAQRFGAKSHDEENSSSNGMHTFASQTENNSVSSFQNQGSALEENSYGLASNRETALSKRSSGGMADGNSDETDVAVMPFDIWVEGKASRFDQGGNDGRFAIVHAGMDYLFTPDLLIGIGAQFDWTSMETGAESDVNGFGFLVGPYLTARLAPDFYFDMRAAWGQSNNDVSPYGTYTDRFGTERWLVSAALFGETQWGEITVRPETRLSWFREESESYTDSLNVNIPAVIVETGTLEFGPTFTIQHQLDNYLLMEPFFMFEGIWTFRQENTATAISDQPGIGDTGIRGRVETGFNLTNNTGQSLSLSVSYDGIGDGSYEAWSGKLYLRSQF